MIKIYFTLITAACLVWTGVLFSGTPIFNEADSERLENTIERYHQDGYTILGPVQYLGKTNKQINLYRQPSVPYTKLQVRNLMGVITVLKAQNYVYVFTKNRSVVLLRLEKEFENEE